MPSWPRAVSVVLVSLAMLLISGCGGAAPERRARETRIAELGQPTPPPPATLSAEMLTAEAFLPIGVSPIVVGTIATSERSATPEPELTEDLIAAAMVKANARVCVGSDRCFAFPHRLEDARASCTPKGRCNVGGTRRVIVSRDARELRGPARDRDGTGEADPADGA